MNAHIFLSGFVQGVGFRQFVKQNALKFHLKGYVRNLEDNRVEGVFVGEKEKIEKIITLCKKGPFLSEVKDVNVVWNEKASGEQFDSFEILSSTSLAP